MRLGLCCDASEGPAALAAGYDYVEFPAAATETSETTNIFFPSGVQLYGPTADGLPRGKAIIDAAAARGVKLMVLGSGAVRKAPKGMRIIEAEAVFYDLAAALDHHAQTLGLRVAPESLEPSETDVGNSLPDLARALRQRGAPYTADSFHALTETNTEIADLQFWREQVPFIPAHVHFGPYGRAVPASDDASLISFFLRLSELGYDGRVSLECRRKGIPDPAPLRKLLPG